VDPSLTNFDFYRKISEKFLFFKAISQTNSIFSGKFFEKLWFFQASCRKILIFQANFWKPVGSRLPQPSGLTPLHRGKNRVGPPDQLKQTSGNICLPCGDLNSQPLDWLSSRLTTTFVLSSLIALSTLEWWSWRMLRPSYNDHRQIRESNIQPIRRPTYIIWLCKRHALLVADRLQRCKEPNVLKRKAVFNFLDIRHQLSIALLI